MNDPCLVDPNSWEMRFYQLQFAYSQLQLAHSQLYFSYMQLQANSHRIAVVSGGLQRMSIMSTVDSQQADHALGPSVPVQPGTLSLRNSLPFEKKVLLLGGEDALRVCQTEFTNLRMGYEGIDTRGDCDAFLRQFGPMIIEEVRSIAYDKIRDIERSNMGEAIRGNVVSYNENDQHVRHPNNNRSDCTFVNLVCTSAVNAFPKLDHGFTKELLCIMLPSMEADRRMVKFVLAIGSQQKSNRDDGCDGKVRYEVKMLAHDHKFLLDSVRKYNGNAVGSLQHISWHHLTGLIPASRMYQATEAGAPFLFAEQILQQRSVLWPMPQADNRCKNLNATQDQIVQSLAYNDKGGMYHVNGPPGTGKTTTTTELLLQRMGQRPEEKILFTAPSNKAIQVVLQKLVEKNTEGYAIAIIGTGKSACPEHDQYYAAEFFTPIVADLKALRRSNSPWRTRKQDLQAILDDACEQLRYLMDPRRKGLTVSSATIRDVYQALQELSSADLSAITSADTIRIQISRWIDDMYSVGECVENYILEKAQVIFSTLVASGRKNFHKVVKKFHTVIVDEAAQALMAETFIPFKFNPVRYLLVGDPKQLPATVKSPHLQQIGYANSLMYVMKEEMGENSVEVMLTTQYRMASAICQPISDLFYGGKLVTDASVLTRECLRRTHLPAHMLLHSVPCAFIDIDSVERRMDEGSISNPDEAQLVVKVLLYLLNHGVKAHQIGVVTGYSTQVSLLKRLLRESRSYFPDPAISTIDGFQGGEKDFMLFSCVRTSESVGFMKDERRVNVALSRGRYANWVFGQARTWRKSNSPLQRFINWIEDEQRNKVSPRAVVIQSDMLLHSMCAHPSPATTAVAAAAAASPAAAAVAMPTAPLITLSEPSPPALLPSPAPASSAVDSWSRGLAVGTTSTPSSQPAASAVRQRGPPSEYTPPITVSPPALPSSTMTYAKPIESTPTVEPPAPVRQSGGKKNRGKVLVGPAMSTSRK